MFDSPNGCRSAPEDERYRPVSPPHAEAERQARRALETEAAYRRKRWDHLDARVLCRSGYIRLPWP